MRKILSILLVLSSLICNQALAANTMLKIKILPWLITIWGPKSIEFPWLQSKNADQEVIISAWTWNYFYVDDLKSEKQGYYTTISSSDLSYNNNRISRDKIAIKWPQNVTTLSWVVAPQVKIAIWTYLDFVKLDDPLALIYRTEDANWAIWKYWIVPDFKIKIPAYQTIWSYRWILSFTLIE